MSVIIRLQNLPWSANAGDIREFFKGLAVPEGGVHIVGGEKGDAFIAFASDEDARIAMMKSGEILKGLQVTLHLSSRTQMQKVIETARQQATAAQAFSAPTPTPQPQPSFQQATPAMPNVGIMSTTPMVPSRPLANIPERVTADFAQPQTAIYRPDDHMQTMYRPDEPSQPGFSSTFNPMMQQPFAPNIPFYQGQTPVAAMQPRNTDPMIQKGPMNIAGNGQMPGQFYEAQRLQTANQASSTDALLVTPSNSGGREQSKDRRDSPSGHRDKRPRDSRDDRRRRSRSRSRDRRRRHRSRSRSRSRDRGSRRKRSRSGERSSNRDRRSDSSRSRRERNEPGQSSNDANANTLPQNTNTDSPGGIPGLGEIPKDVPRDNLSIFSANADAPPTRQGQSRWGPRNPTLADSRPSDMKHVADRQSKFSEGGAPYSDNGPFSRAGPSPYGGDMDGPRKGTQPLLELPAPRANWQEPNNSRGRPRDLRPDYANGDDNWNSRWSEDEQGRSRSHGSPPRSARPMDDRNREPYGDADRRFHSDSRQHLHAMGRQHEGLFDAIPPPNGGRGHPFEMGGMRGMGGPMDARGRGFVRGRGRGFPPSEGSRERRSKTCSIEVLNVPGSASYKAIRDVFTGIYMPSNSIKLLADSYGNRIGVALLRFASTRDTYEAFKRSGSYLANSRVEINFIDDSVYDNAADMNQHRERPNWSDSRGRTRCLRIGGLPSRCTEQDVAQIFNDVEIETIVMEYHPKTEDATGFCFVRLRTPEMVAHSLSRLVNITMDSHVLRIDACPEGAFDHAMRCRNNATMANDDPTNDKDDHNNKRRENGSPSASSNASLGADLLTDSVILRNVSRDIDDSVISTFFDNAHLPPEKVFIGSPVDEHTCEAYVTFAKIEDATKALQKSDEKIGSHNVKIELVSKPVVMKAMGLPFNPLELFEKSNRNKKPLKTPQSPKRQSFETEANDTKAASGSSFTERRTAYNGPPSNPPPRFSEAQNANVAPDNFGIPGCVVSLSNVPYSATTDDILFFFKDFAGLTADCVIRRYDELNRPTADARVALPSKQEARRAAQTLSRKYLFNRPVNVNVID